MAKKEAFKLTWNGDAALADIERAAKAAVTAGALLVVGQVKQLTPVGNGDLRDSISEWPENHPAKVDGSKVVATVGSSLDYAVYQEFGTGEFAENGSGRKGGWSYRDPEGNWHFTRGNKPQRMFRNGYKLARANVVAVVRSHMQRVGGGLK